MITKPQITVADLYQVPDKGKAEVVNGELVRQMPTGGIPGRAGGKIYRSLDDYERLTGRGFAFPDNVGFLVTFPIAALSVRMPPFIRDHCRAGSL